MKDSVFGNGRKCPHAASRIMLVDDDEDDQSIFLGVVEKVNPELVCVSAWNGLEALTLLKQMDKLPELIFLDLNMPLMNGHQFLAEIQKEIKFSDIPVIVLTTSSQSDSRDKAMHLGASHFITKPNNLPAWEEQLTPILTASNEVVNSEKDIGDG